MTTPASPWIGSSTIAAIEETPFFRIVVSSTSAFPYGRVITPGSSGAKGAWSSGLGVKGSGFRVVAPARPSVAIVDRAVGG